MTSVHQLTGLFSEINDLKRTRRAGAACSVAENCFRRAWASLQGGADPLQTALQTTAHLVTGTRLGAIDSSVLAYADLSTAQISDILSRSFDSVAENLDPQLSKCLREQLAQDLVTGPVPEFVDRLCNQPRAGATRPGRARIALLPPESHGDHCLTVAAYSVLLAPCFGSGIEMPFLAALSHHLHNAWLPDSGFTGEELLGEHLLPVTSRFRATALDQLNDSLRSLVVDSLEATSTADTPEGKAFHAADVIDRVLQMKWYEEAAGFKLKMALEDMQLVHAGPVQSFHLQILEEAGLW